MDNQSRSSTMDHRDIQTLLWAQNEAVTMWKSLFGRLRRRKSNEGSLRTSLRFSYILYSSNKTRDKRPADLNGLKSLKRGFFYIVRCAHQMFYLACSFDSFQMFNGKMTSVQATTEVRLTAVGDATSSWNLMDHWSHWWQDQSSNNLASLSKLACGQEQVSSWPAGSVCTDSAGSCGCRCQIRLHKTSDRGHFRHTAATNCG